MQGDFEKNEGILQLFTPIWPIRENLPDRGEKLLSQYLILNRLPFMRHVMGEHIDT